MFINFDDGDKKLNENCKFKEATCYNCQKQGHIASVCQQKRQQFQSNAITISPIANGMSAMVNDDPKANHNSTTKKDETFAFCLAATVTKDPKANNKTNEKMINDDPATNFIQVQVLINDIQCEMKLDTASQISMFKETTWKQLGKPKLFNSNVIAKNCNNQSIAITGKFQCNVQFQGKKATLIGYVSNDIQHDLLGIPWIRALQMLPKNFGRRSNPKTTWFQGQFGSTTKKNARHPAVGKKMAMDTQHRGNKTTMVCPNKPKSKVRQHEPKSEIRRKEPTTFYSKEPILLKDYRNGKQHWLPGTILGQLNDSTTYRVHVPSLGCNVHRNKNQMRRQLDAEWNNKKEPTIQHDKNRTNASEMNQVQQANSKQKGSCRINIQRKKQFKKGDVGDEQNEEMNQMAFRRTKRHSSSFLVHFYFSNLTFLPSLFMLSIDCLPQAKPPISQAYKRQAFFLLNVDFPSQSQFYRNYYSIYSKR